MWVQAWTFKNENNSGCQWLKWDLKAWMIELNMFTPQEKQTVC
jgi:hypothetical protein